MAREGPTILEQLLREGRLLSQRLTYTDPMEENKYDRDATPRLQYDIPPEFRTKKKKKGDPELEQYDTKKGNPKEGLQNVPRDRLDERAEPGTGVYSGKTMRDLLMGGTQYPGKLKEGMY